MPDLPEAGRAYRDRLQVVIPTVKELERRVIRARRRRRARAGIATAIVVAVVGVAAWLMPGQRATKVVVGRPGTAAAPQTVGAPATSPGPQAAPVPALLVGHVPTQTGKPGDIQVVATATGTVVRSLGSVYDPYLENGFVVSPDGRTLFYTRLDEAAQVIEIVEVPVGGGPTSVVADGTHPQVSPDGSLLAYQPFGRAHVVSVMSLSSRTVTNYGVPPALADEGAYSIAWLPDSTSLIVTGKTVASACTGPPGASCPTATTPTAASAALLHTGQDGTWTDLAAPSGIPTGWLNLTLAGPGPSPGTVVGIENAGGHQTFCVIDAAGHQPAKETPLPPGTTFLSETRDGSLALLAGPTSTLSWTPAASSDPVTVGPVFAEAAW